MKRSSTIAKLVPFWNNLSEEEKRELSVFSQEQSFIKGSYIHNAEQACIGVFFVKSGRARAYMLSEEGKELTLFHIQEQESCVLSASCVMPLITFDILVEASTETTILILPSDYYSRLMEQNPAVESYTYKQATIRFSQVMWVMQQQLFKSFDQRLAAFLLDESTRTRSNRINLTHEEIAKNIGSAREVVSRTLKDFSTKGFTESFRGGVLIVDEQRLRKLSYHHFLPKKGEQRTALP